MKKIVSLAILVGLTAPAVAAPSYLTRTGDGGYRVTYNYTDKAKTGWYVGGRAELGFWNWKNKYDTSDNFQGDKEYRHADDSLLRHLVELRIFDDRLCEYDEPHSARAFRKRKAGRRRIRNGVFQNLFATDLAYDFYVYRCQFGGFLLRPGCCFAYDGRIFPYEYGRLLDV